MKEKKQILIVSKDGKGGIVTHPGQFDYPEKKMVAERWFYNTGRFSTVNGERSAVFTEEGFNLNLDDFADPKTEEEVMTNTEALQELQEIVGEDSIFIDMIIGWHNKHISERVDQ